MCQKAYALVSPDSGFSHSAKLCVLVTSPSPRTALGPAVWLQGEGQAEPGPRLTCRWESCILREPTWTTFCFLSGFAAPYTALHTLDCGGHTHIHAYHTDTHIQTYAMHTTYYIKSIHHIQKYFSITVTGYITVLLTVAFGSPSGL